MKKQNNSSRASALQITPSATLILISAVLLASSFQAAPAASELSAPIAPALEGDKNLASGTWTVTGSLNTTHQFHTATLLPNGKVLVAGGAGSSLPGYLTSAELYDPASGSWTVTGSLNTPRYEHTATLLPNGKVLVAGGYGYSSSNLVDLTSVELYDPASGSWTFTSNLDTVRHGHTATLLPNGKVLVAGGYHNNGVYPTSAQLYDPASGSWTATGSLNTARAFHTATLLPNGKVLVAGGANSSGFLTSAELYDPASGSWTATGRLNTAREDHKATLLPNGKVLVAGGYSGPQLASAELYDPASGSWTTVGSLNTDRDGHTATLLLNGKVLVAGGYSGVYGSSGVLTSAELYDPASGSWMAMGSLITGRELHTATLLPNGKVLVAGGYNSGALASAELSNTDTGEICSVCHKHTVTVSLTCGSLELQRHVDHGDTLGTCQSASEKK